MNQETMRALSYLERHIKSVIDMQEEKIIERRKEGLSTNVFEGAIAAFDHTLNAIRLYRGDKDLQ